MKRFLPLRRLYFHLRDECGERIMLARMFGGREIGGDKKRRQWVSYYAYAGLGNRLRAHLIASAYALRTRRELLISWEKNDHLTADFGELFEWNGATKASCRSVLRVPYVKGKKSDQGDRVDFDQDLLFFKAQWQFVDTDYLLNSTKELLPVLLRKLQPVKTIADLAANIKRAWPENVVGIHVRRGDFVTHTDEAIPIERYVKAARQSLAAMPGGAQIFLASDATDKELRELYAAFAGSIKRYPSRPRHTAEGARDALRDLLLLSSTKHLILTRGSTFGEFAALYGNVPVTFA